MEIIRELLWLWILGALGGSGYMIWALYVRSPVATSPTGRPAQAITTRRTPPQPPVARPAGSSIPVAPSRTPQPGAGEHQRRGSAPTVKLPAEQGTDRIRKPSDDDKAAVDLFGGLSAAKAKADAAPPIVVPGPPQLAIPKDIAEQVQRLEDRGFHVGTLKAEPPPVVAAAASTPKSDVPAAELPGQARSQTAELDDILKRIDAVLSESGTPASEATLTNPQSTGQQTMPLPTVHNPPPTEKLERKGTDPNQQKLF